MSDFHLLAEFDDAADGDLEIGGGLLGNFTGEGEQVFAPAGHAGFGAGDDDFPAQEKRGFLSRDVEPVLFAATEEAWHLWFLHETVAARHPPEPLTEVLDFDAFAGQDIRLVLNKECHEDNALMENLVVL